MDEWNGERVILFAPRRREEAARVLGRCTELAAAGRAVRAGVLESPYRPGARYGHDCVGSADLDRDRVTVARRVGDGEIEGGRFEHVEIPLCGTSEEALRAIESGDRDGALCLLVTLCRMNRIHEVSKTDLLAVVDGGVAWNELVPEIERAGLYLPYGGPPFLDVVSGGVTVAEVVTGGWSASTDGRFGGLREHVLSLELATPGGGAIHTGSRAVKDVGGYDLTGFLLGEGGRCGVVTRVTLRLLPAPGSRMVFAARGTAGELRSLARIVHRRMRPAFLEIHGGRAAALLAGGETGGTDARTLIAGDAAGDIGGGALLVGELQAPDAGAEDRLLEEAVSASGRGPRPVRCDSEIVANRMKLAALASRALDGGNGVVCISCETSGERIERPGAIMYRSLYPERLHGFVARGEIDPSGGTECGDSSIRPRTMIDVLSSFGAERDPGLGSEVVLLYECDGSLDYRRIHRDDFDRPLSAVLRGELPRRATRHRDPFDVLWARARGVFDPQGIMLP
jgi:FAD/FMN-containing dehydrogenase